MAGVPSLGGSGRLGGHGMRPPCRTFFCRSVSRAAGRQVSTARHAPPRGARRLLRCRVGVRAGVLRRLPSEERACVGRPAPPPSSSEECPVVPPGSTSPVFTMACQAYDRMQPLRDGTVRVGGAQLNFLDLPVEETFFRMLK